MALAGQPELGMGWWSLLAGTFLWRVILVAGQVRAALATLLIFTPIAASGYEGLRNFSPLLWWACALLLAALYAAAPLLGLTGTVWALLRVFSAISGETGLPDPVEFTSGVALALSATLLGLTIAVPALIGGGYLQRRVENYAAQLDVLLERILGRAEQEAEAVEAASGDRI
jgi:hypothetical protein